MTSADHSLGVAIIGCGRIARAHAEAIAATPDAHLTWVCDVDEHAARSLAHDFAAHEYSCDARTLLETSRPDIAIVCTPPISHREIACDCLRAGVHVLCEKPLGIAPDEVETMNDVARETGRVLMMASKFRFVAAVRKARETIASGALGELLLWRNSFLAPVDMKGRMNAQRKVSGGGVLMDNGPHAFDLARFLLGPIIPTRAETLPSQQQIEVEDGAQIGFTSERFGSLRGAICLSWSAHAATPHFLEICGTRGALAIGWNDYDKKEAFQAQLKHFMEVARGRSQPLVSQPLVTPDDALSNARIIAQCYGMMTNGKRAAA